MEPHDNLWHSRCPPRRNIQCETTVQTPRNATHLERDMEVGMRQELGARPEVPRLPCVATMGQHHACEHITSALPPTTIDACSSKTVTARYPELPPTDLQARYYPWHNHTTLATPSQVSPRDRQRVRVADDEQRWHSRRQAVRCQHVRAVPRVGVRGFRDGH